MPQILMRTVMRALYTSSARLRAWRTINTLSLGEPDEDAMMTGKILRTTIRALMFISLLAGTSPARAQAPEKSPVKLYVANFGGNDIHVIDTATNKVLKRVE